MRGVLYFSEFKYSHKASVSSGVAENRGIWLWSFFPASSIPVVTARANLASSKSGCSTLPRISGPGRGFPPLALAPWQFLQALTLIVGMPRMVGIGPALSLPVSKIIFPSANPVTAGVAGAEADGVVDGEGSTAAGGVAVGVLRGADEHPADNPDTAATTEIAMARRANLIR